MLRLNKLKRPPTEYIGPSLESILDPKDIRELIVKYVYRSLKGKNWNITHTSKALGLSLRTLRNYINYLRQGGVDIPRWKGPHNEPVDK